VLHCISPNSAQQMTAVGKGVGHKITVTVGRSFSNVKLVSRSTLSTWLSGVVPSKSSVYVDSTLSKPNLHQHRVRTFTCGGHVIPVGLVQPEDHNRGHCLSPLNYPPCWYAQRSLDRSAIWVFFLSSLHACVTECSASKAGCHCRTPEPF
jgi:hypothetical protein